MSHLRMLNLSILLPHGAYDRLMYFMMVRFRVKHSLHTLAYTTVFEQSGCNLPEAFALVHRMVSVIGISWHIVIYTLSSVLKEKIPQLELFLCENSSA